MVWRESGDSTVETTPESARPGAGRRHTTAGDGSIRRVVGRRRALPSARAVVGGFLVAGAALVVFVAVMAGAGGSSGRDFAVAARSLPAGSLIEPGDLSMKSMHLPSTVAGAAFATSDGLIGKTVAVPVSAGELLESAMLAGTGGTSTRPVTVSVDPGSLGGLAPGQPVDVLEANGSGGSGTVSVVVRGATLLAASRGTSGLLSNPGAVEVTIGVSSLDEVEAVIAASHSGTLTLVAAQPSDGVGPGPGPASGAGG